MSTLALMAANLLPLYLVISGQWSLVQILLLFWFENVIIGSLNIVKILTCRGEDTSATAKKVFSSAFFLAHYGMFTLAHGMIVITLFADQPVPEDIGISPALISYGVQHYELLWPALILCVSHLFSLLSNYYLGGEYRRIGTAQLMSQPYTRVMILHVTIIIGGLVAKALGQPLLALAVLVLLKIAIDGIAHRREHAGDNSCDEPVITS